MEGKGFFQHRTFSSQSYSAGKEGYLNIEDVKALKDKGTIAGGMIPKVDCCVQAIEEGVTSVNIIDGRKPHSVLYEAFTNEGTGTTIGTAQPSVGIKW